MEDVQENGPVFRMTGGVPGAGGGKSELAARGGSGGALALSRAPVGGSASPAPAPLPQPAPSPAPAALPPPAPPPPPFRADLPHRARAAHAAHTPAAHIPSLDARTPAAAPDPPATELQPHGAGSPTPAPPAPSPLFPSHAAYPPHAALPDYRRTNHEARSKPAPRDPPAPLDLHHAPHPRPSLPAHALHGAPHPILPGQDVRNPAAAPAVPTSFPSHAAAAHNGLPHPLAPVHGALPSHGPPHSVGRPASPPGLPPRPYNLAAQPPATTTTAPAHVAISANSSISNHSIAYQSQSSVPQKHHMPQPLHGRPHHATFGPPNHLASHLPPAGVSHSIAHHVGHTTTNHSMANHLSHSTPPISHAISNHTGPLLSQSSSSNPMPNFGAPHGHRPPSLGLPLHPSPASALLPAAGLHSISNHSEAPSGAGAPPAGPGGAPPPAAPPAPADTRPPAPPCSTSAESVHSRTASPAVVSSHAPNGYLQSLPAAYAGASYPPLYAPYATSLQHSVHPYLPPSAASPRNTADTRTSLAASPLVAPKTPKNIRPHTPGSTGAAGTAPPQPLPPQPPVQPLPAQHVYSPRGHSPNRERDSYSSNISSLSRASGGTPVSYPSVSVSSSNAPPLSNVLSSAPTIAPMTGPLVPPLAAPLAPPLAAPTPTPAAPAVTHLSHTLAPVPTLPSISSSKPPAHWGVSGSSSSDRPHGFPPGPTAPPLFTAPLPPPNPNPFSAESLFQTSPSADLLRRELDNRFLAAAGGAFNVRTEMHHHQHQHTHVHQHPTLAPHPAAPPPQLAHPAHAPHPQGLFVTPPVPPMFKDVKMASLYRHGLGLGYPYSSGLMHPGLSASTPFMPPSALSTFTPKKTGKWNAMHVRIAWEIYNHQQKGGAGGAGGAGGPDKDKLRASTFPPGPPVSHAPVHAAPPPPHPYRSPYDHLPPSPYLQHHPHLGVSPFARYGAGAYPGAPPPFGLSPYATRDLGLSSSLHAPHHPSSLAALHEAWRAGAVTRPPQPLPPSTVAAAEARREHDERERARREREIRERRDQDERRKQREREMERVRQRSPLRNGVPESVVKDERKEMPRAPPPPQLGYPPPPAAWDPYRPYDLQHMRFTPIVEAAIRAEEDRAKMLSAYAAHHQQLKPSSMLHRPLPPHPSSLAPLASLDLLKKEEPR